MPKLNGRGGASSGELRSGLEDAVSDQLKRLGVDFEYERFNVPYISKTRKYRPDFLLPNGVIVETKGQFVSADRTKMKLVKEQHPTLDIRFVFSNSRARIGKKSSTTYAMWCETNGFQYADKFVPITWTREARNEAALAAVAKLRTR